MGFLGDASLISTGSLSIRQL